MKKSVFIKIEQILRTFVVAVMKSVQLRTFGQRGHFFIGCASK